MAAAFLANLMRPIDQMLSSPSSSRSPNDPPKTSHQGRVPLPQLALGLGQSNPWLEASFSLGLDVAHRCSAQASSLSTVAQLSLPLHGSSQALGAMCESFSQTAALLGISEGQVVAKLKDLTDPCRKRKAHSAEYAALKGRLRRKISTLYEQRLEEGKYRCREAERKADLLADAARVEIAKLGRMLGEERRANSDLLLSLEALRSAGADTSALRSFLSSKAPSLQKAAYLDAKVCLLKKIQEKYPDADLQYFIDVGESPNNVDPPSEWLVVPARKYDYVSSLSAPPISLNKKRRLS